MKVEITIECDTIREIQTSLAAIRKKLTEKRRKKKLRRRDKFDPFLIASKKGNWAVGVDIE